jgi:hypothetical protein
LDYGKKGERKIVPLLWPAVSHDRNGTSYRETMKIWGRLSAWLSPRTSPLGADPVCVQDGNLRAYIWPTHQQFSYEVVNAMGERLSVGAARDLDLARTCALRLMSDFRRDR